MKILSPFAFVALAAAAGLASAQQPATTVQLPTFSQFTVRTTVSVPDGGTAYLGGLDRAFDSSVTRGIGPLRSRGTSSGRAASGVSVSATITDHAEMDRAILAAAAAGRRPTAPVDAKARQIASALAETRVSIRRDAPPIGGAVLPGSLAAIAAENAAHDQQRADEIADYLHKAEQAEAAGKTSVAKVYYQLVARSSSPQRQQAAARLAALAKPIASK